jgi:diketogulonate reductase-like aldo/keto reductase
MITPPPLHTTHTWLIYGAQDIFLERENLLQLENRSKPFIASIGVSNFDIKDMNHLLENARIPPQIYQGDSWLVFHNADLMDLLFKHQIFFQAYSVFGR